MKSRHKKTVWLTLLFLLLVLGAMALLIVAEHNTYRSGFGQGPGFHRLIDRLLHPVTLKLKNLWDAVLRFLS